MTCGIYCIVNMVTGEEYVGSAIDIDRRWRTHFAQMKAGTHPNSLLAASVLTHGCDQFGMEVLEQCLPEDLVEREEYWIAVLKPGFNTRTGCGGRPAAGHGRIADDIRQVVLNISPNMEAAARKFAADNGVGRLSDALVQLLNQQLRKEGLL